MMAYDPDMQLGGYDNPNPPYDEFYADRFTRCPACLDSVPVGGVLEHIRREHYPHRVPSTFPGEQPENVPGQLSLEDA